jgi:endo-1,4-beta-mannosidase
MWWCAFDQGDFDYAPYRWNTIGSDYGFFSRDLKEKPIVKENKNFCKLLKKLPERRLPPHQTDACVIVPRETYDNTVQLNNIMRSTYILAKQANMDIRFSYALDPIPDAKLYIFTGLTHDKTITKQRLDELLEKVKGGAVLYLSLDNGLFRQIPEITGVQIEYRKQVNKEITVDFHGQKLPIFTQFFYKIEQYEAEPLARCESGEPVFFRYSLGKGFVYLLTLPLEHHLSSTPDAFYRDDAAHYHLFYRELAKVAGITRICDSDHPYVRLTEHPIDEHSLYITAINYNNKPATARLSIMPGYTVTSVLGDGLQENTLTLRENDGVIFRLEKK